MSPLQSAISQENWKLLESLLKNSPPDENAIKSIVKVGLVKPVSMFASSQYRFNKYGDQSQNMIHYIASYGNIEQINELAYSHHWEELKAAQDTKGRTALDVVSELLDKGRSILDDEHKFEVFGEYSDDIGAYTPWSENMDNDVDFATYIKELVSVVDKLGLRRLTTERG